MRTYDLYGFAADGLEDARVAVERALGISLVPHEALYMGGDYYRVSGWDEEKLVLRINHDLLDDEPAELEFPDVRVLLYVEGTNRPKELEQALTTQIAGLRLLRRQQL